MTITSHLVVSRLMGSHLLRGTTGGSGGGVAGADEGYLLESGGTDHYLLDTGVVTESYLLEGAFLCTENTAAPPNETLILAEHGPIIEVEQGDVVNLLDEANGDRMLSEQSATIFISGEQNG